MSVIERIRTALSEATDREHPPATEPAESAESIESPAPAESAAPTPASAHSIESTETRLYRCEPCSITYVSDEKDACSQCNASVERIPTEQDLGLV